MILTHIKYYFKNNKQIPVFSQSDDFQKWLADCLKHAFPCFQWLAYCYLLSFLQLKVKKTIIKNCFTLKQKKNYSFKGYHEIPIYFLAIFFKKQSSMCLIFPPFEFRSSMVQCKDLEARGRVESSFFYISLNKSSHLPEPAFSSFVKKRNNIYLTGLLKFS